jgi:hypothetical protein
MSLPPGWSVSLAGNRLSQFNDIQNPPILPSIDDETQHVEHEDETSPHAVQQVTALITKLVRGMKRNDAPLVGSCVSSSSVLGVSDNVGLLKDQRKLPSSVLL